MTTRSPLTMWREARSRGVYIRASSAAAACRFSAATNVRRGCPPPDNPDRRGCSRQYRKSVKCSYSAGSEASEGVPSLLRQGPVHTFLVSLGPRVNFDQAWRRYYLPVARMQIGSYSDLNVFHQRDPRER